MTPFLLGGFLAVCAQLPQEKEYSFAVSRLVEWEHGLELSGGLEDERSPFLIGDVRRSIINIKNLTHELKEIRIASKDCGCSAPPSGTQKWIIAPSGSVSISQDLIINGEQNAVELTVSMVLPGTGDPLPVLRSVTSAVGTKVLTARFGGIIRVSVGPPLLAIDFDIVPELFSEQLLPRIAGYRLQNLDRDGAVATGFYSTDMFAQATWPSFNLPDAQLQSWKGVPRENLSCETVKPPARLLHFFGYSGIGGTCSIQRRSKSEDSRLVEARVWGIPEAMTSNLRISEDGTYLYDLFLPHEVLYKVGQRIVLCELWRDSNGRELVSVEPVIPGYSH